MHLLKKEFNRNKIYGTLVFGLFLGSFLFGQHSTNFIHLPFKLDNHNIKVTHSVQDSLGFVWLAHAEGISKYDGYNYEFTPKDLIFKEDTTSDEVKKIFRDAKGVIWALSMNGQISYLQKNGRFLSIDNSIKDFQKEYKVNIIHEDNGIVWMATNKGSIFSYDHSIGVVDSITTIPANSIGLNEVNSLVVRKSNQLIVSTYKGPHYIFYLETKLLERLEVPYDYTLADNNLLLLDKKNRLWIGSSYAGHGLMVYDFSKESFVQDEIIQERWRGQLSELFTSMYCDVNGVIWLGTDGNGLYRLDPETGDLGIYKHNDLNGFSLSTNTVIGINEDLKNNLWVLTNYGDINILRNRNSQINYHSGSVQGRPARVLSSFKAKDGTLWIGTDGDGITKVSANGEEEQFFNNTPGSKGFYIHSINEDSESNVLVATYKNGLWKYNTRSHKFSKVPLRNSKNNMVMDVRFIFKDSKHRLWVTTDLGIYLFSERNTLLAHFENDNAGLFGGISQSVVEDSSGTVWLAYNGGGLFRFNENIDNILKSNFTRYLHVDNQLIPNKNYHIWSMAASGDEVLWLVLVNGDLIKFNISKQQFEPVKIKGTYENTTFRSVLLENKDNLWLGSTNGIWHLNVRDSISRVFQKSDGLQDDSFMQRSAHNGTDGNFYFGGLNGVNYFKPNHIKKEESVAKLFIEDIDILNQPSISVIPEQIKEGVERIDVLKLDHDQSSFFFRFLAIDNVLFSNYNYAYRLRGFNDNWILSEKERLATYTNIPPGRYVFEVKASSGNGEWDIEQKSVAITILQPFWKSSLAKVFYTLLFIGLLYGIVIWIRLRNRVIADELEHKHERELYALKMNFFAKMSHEIQTPLTLILIPLENMLDRATKSGNVLLQQRLRLISNNANRLSRIVFELTSLRDKELEKLVLRASEHNIIGDLKEITSSFEEQATFKGINFKCSYPNEELKMWYDKDKMEHVFFNLLSNAFKFTPKGGAITLDVIVEDWERNVKISVTDSGPGIPKEELENIFQLFYQADSGKQKVGTGIGLALTKELIDLHSGKIDVKSDPIKGTCFSVRFPIDGNRNDSLQGELMVEDTIIEVEDVDHELKEETNGKGYPKLAKTILVVEDNYELQISLKDIFSDYYNVLLAENGEEGYALALEHNPDLIISDIMMPKMDGIEMSGMLQKNELTTHIPIILLTAKKTSKNKILGLRTGALEYISKPFNINELVLKVNNIITRSDRIILKYKNDLITAPKSGSGRSQDEVFLEKLVGLVENQMSNPDFKLEDLSSELNMSYSAIYRKFQALTGKKIVDFVRTMRLKKAAILISDCNYSVSEAAFLVGFNDPKYFSKCFKKEFGKNPRKLKGRVDSIEVSDL
ncbi:response regulator [Arenibacter sp. BSSL-BM3]|uniref:histidine kinase n=1 Tax=Arenibacter arenosicollis TaxID=2762274 RepID=A0ABR7QNV1_9FLAO|nr:ATP-binding protein [Arenibacter arenosicollis]MBC8768602.1 response regulator [Arenibacter arenosicollis]